jgi:hypothetical protein
MTGMYHDKVQSFRAFFVFVFFLSRNNFICFVVVEHIRHDQNAKGMWDNDQNIDCVVIVSYAILDQRISSFLVL